MIRVTFTFTRQTAETPWFWEIHNSALSPLQNFAAANNLVETIIIDGNQQISTWVFDNEQLYEDFGTLINNDIESDYVQYCNNNDITINVVTEDV